RMMGLRGRTFQSVKRTRRAQRFDGATARAEWFDQRPGRDASARLWAGACKLLYQALTLVARLNSSPDLSIACMMTASLRATATAARLKPIFSLSFRPHVRRSLSAYAL